MTALKAVQLTANRKFMKATDHVALTGVTLIATGFYPFGSVLMALLRG